MMNENEFQDLLERHRRSLEAFCFSTRRNEGDGEDLLQDIWARAWDARSTFRGESSFHTWLYVVAKSVYITNYHRKKHLPVVFPEKLPELEDPIDDDRETINDLHAAVQQLNDRDKDLISLYLDERSYKEIALEINTTEKNVATRFMRVKEKLRKLLNRRQ
jgi:RNA polymerase sigma-70 factor (ECF subfamily)